MSISSLSEHEQDFISVLLTLFSADTDAVEGVNFFKCLNVESWLLQVHFCQYSCNHLISPVRRPEVRYKTPGLSPRTRLDTSPLPNKLINFQSPHRSWTLMFSFNLGHSGDKSVSNKILGYLCRKLGHLQPCLWWQIRDIFDRMLRHLKLSWVVTKSIFIIKRFPAVVLLTKNRYFFPGS